MDKPIFNTHQEYQHYRWYKLYMPITCCICGNAFNPFSDVYFGRNENGEIKSVCTISMDDFIEMAHEVFLNY